jgi:hypothetical protein
VSRLLRLYEKKRGHRRTGSSKLGSVGEACFFGIFFLLGLATLIVMLLAVVWPEWRANRHFVATTCTVLEKRIDIKPGENGPTFGPQIKIAYQVNGKAYSPNTYDARRSYFGDKAKAEAALAAFELQKQYTCWYDPLRPENAVLVRGYSGWQYLLLLVPIAFLAIGGGGFAYTVLQWGTSTERRSALTQRAGNFDLLNEPDNERVIYPNIPADVDVKNSPGVVLAYRLPIASKPGWQLFAAFVACLFWNGITSIFVVIAVRSHLQGNPEWFLTVFIIPFVLIGLLLIYSLVRQLLITAGVGPTRLEISAHPLHPGEACEVMISQAGRLTMNTLQVRLVCDEHATYRQGTDTRSEERRVYSVELYERKDFAIDQAIPLEERCKLQVPASAMHSFKSTHNEIRWKLIVKGDVAGWPNFEREFRILVFPAAHRGSSE